MSLATEHRFAHHLCQGTVHQGWSCVLQGRVEEGITTIRQELAAIRNPGQEVRAPCACLAGGGVWHGRPD